MTATLVVRDGAEHTLGLLTLRFGVDSERIYIADQQPKDETSVDSDETSVDSRPHSESPCQNIHHSNLIRNQAYQVFH